MMYELMSVMMTKITIFLIFFPLIFIICIMICLMLGILKPGKAHCDCKIPCCSEVAK